MFLMIPPRSDERFIQEGIQYSSHISPDSIVSKDGSLENDAENTSNGKSNFHTVAAKSSDVVSCKSGEAIDKMLC